jgi:hypothetical protein
MPRVTIDLGIILPAHEQAALAQQDADWQARKLTMHPIFSQ